VIVDCAHYRDGVRQRAEPLTLDEIETCRTLEDDGFLWLGLLNPDEGELARVGRIFGIHELALEDTATLHERPKVEAHGDQTLVILRSAEYDDERELVITGELQLLLGRGYVVVVRHGQPADLRKSRRDLEARPELLCHGPAAVLWKVLDRVVDGYDPVVAGLEQDIGEVEDSVFDEDDDVDERVTARIYFLRRELSVLYRAMHPLLQPLTAVETNSSRVPDPLRPFYRDVLDHVRRIHDEVLGQQDLLNGIMHANLALSSQRQADVVRKVSSYAAIITVPTLIASIYGMNFEHMPELGWVGGYPMALSLMAATALALRVAFKRTGWL